MLYGLYRIILSETGVAIVTLRRNIDICRDKLMSTILNIYIEVLKGPNVISSWI